MAKDLLGVEIFSTGTFTPGGSAKGRKVTITSADLDEMVQSFQELVPIGGFTPVLKLGHAEAQRFMGQASGAPNLGIVKMIRRVGNKIIADFANVPDAVMDLIRLKRFRNVSVEIVPSIEFDGRTFANVLTAVALLGAELPAVKGLKELAAMMFTEAEVSPVQADTIVSYEWEREKMPDTNLTQDQHEALLEAAVTKAVAVAKAEFASGSEKLTAERDAAMAEVKTGAAKFSAFQTEVATKEAAAMVDGAIKAGKLLPKQKDAAMAFATNLTGTVKFGNEEKSMTVLFADFLGAMPSKVDLGEKGGSNVDEKGEEYADANTKVVALIEAARKADKELSYSDALKGVLASDEELKLAYFNMT